ncbi:TrmH family tRNA/rRNA methyltransferase [Candidatus Ornithobacterium hominis]|uniref:RNA methyltransferase n=1 Tax=Candidatus Ornithobacterium hominis TaxID=2497989 RepID=UPI0024BCB713|nr:RNA methyltransferase [Candidatus Ornithobacterium hominis]CAI9429054.1 TrmH family tRNA/rRNA methyltransferase [Candidatus Ornithobacterium hominis]
MKKLSLEELNRLDLKTYRSKEKLPIVVILDDIRSMHNVGSVFRTSDAFLIEKIVLCGITATPPHKEIRKTAIGATESVEWEYVPTVVEAIQKLQQENYKIIGIEQTDESARLDDFPIDKGEKYALIFGNEVNGVADEAIERCDACLEIPQAGTKHSLNVSVCAGIVLWKFFKALKK